MRVEIMKQTISKSAFIDEFRVVDRLENFSYEGRELLFDYIEELEDSTGEEYELDAIALCCEFSEDTPDEIANNYSIDLSDCDNDDEKLEAVREYLEENTRIVGETSSGTIVYQTF